MVIGMIDEEGSYGNREERNKRYVQMKFIWVCCYLF